MSNYDHHGDHKIHRIWQTHKKYPYEFRRVQRKYNGRWNRYGELRRENGEVTYWAQRRFDQLYYEHNGWALDHSTLTMLNCFKVDYVGVLEDTGEWWRMPYATFDFLWKARPEAIDLAKAKGIEYIDWSKRIGKRPGATGVFGAIQWVVPLSTWPERSVPKKQNILDAMQIRERRTYQRKALPALVSPS